MSRWGWNGGAKIATEGIKRVRQAEDAAEDIIDEAAEAADRMISDARAEASRRVAAAAEKARRDGGELAKRIKKETDEQVRSQREDTERARLAIKQRAVKSIGSAVRTVLDTIESP